MSPRRLIDSDDAIRRYEVTNGSGTVLGIDEEPAPDTEAANLGTIAAAARDYMDTSTPSAAENARQVRRLTRLVLHLYEATD